MRSGANLSVVRDHNQALILQLIRDGDGISRVELARRTGLTAQTVTNIVSRLIGQGFVVEAGKQSSAAGKPRVRVRLNPAGGYAIGVRIGRAELAVVIVDLDGAVVAKTTRPTDPARTPAGIVDVVAADITSLTAGSGVDPARIFGIGVAAPGPLDHEAGVVLGPPHFPGWDEVPLGRMLQERMGTPVVVDYNAKAAATWERWAGVARQTRDFAFVYASTGVGAGVFLDGELLRGHTGGAGALGHVGIDPDGPPCSCGGQGCLELYCAAPAIVARARRELATHDPRHAAINLPEVQALAATGDPVAIAIFTDAARTLGYGVKSLVNLTDVDLIVLGGRVFDGIGGLFVDILQRILDDQSYGHRRRAVSVAMTAAPGDPGAVGAATLVLHARLTPKLAGLPIR